MSFDSSVFSLLNGLVHASARLFRVFVVGKSVAGMVAIKSERSSTGVQLLNWNQFLETVMKSDRFSI